MPDPPETPLPPDFPDDDRYLAYLAIATGATLVPEDPGVLTRQAAIGDSRRFQLPKPCGGQGSHNFLRPRGAVASRLATPP